ncbi:hypothetical protein [Streptomyces sp. DSM 40750]|uniref:hypothetical protein n=1 Tax=Streptomyces sp. DSM 40750 TaxID=2801030 RepID=UPI00214A9E11|nr:hypothetical protein [Streptomyces sp. DSM 40750]UUU18877.1 hypothetical protein JIX55_00020 [Streptomyces sp. DSM 40750]UUU27781.1 hypothetical protein JIX55_50725 [Streptomyces sp. DSM 40750]
MGLREAHQHHLPDITIAALPYARANDRTFPKSVDKRGAELLYRIGDLKRWARNRPRAATRHHRPRLTTPRPPPRSGPLRSGRHDVVRPLHWVTVRPPEVGLHWEVHGTWLRPPILIDRRFLDPSDSGLQVLEGRTRGGVLRGRRREQLHVARNHQAWVGPRDNVPSLSTLRASGRFPGRAADDWLGA